MDITLTLTQEQAIAMLAEIQRQTREHEKYMTFLAETESKLIRQLKAQDKTWWHAQQVVHKTERRIQRIVYVLTKPIIIKPGSPQWREIPQNMAE